MEPSVFTHIVNRDIPCHAVYEDDQCMAFMDIAPVQDGMIVLVPKQQIAHFEDIPAQTAAHLTSVAQKLMRALRTVFPDKKKIALIVEGLDLPDHAHIKLIPVSSGEELAADPPTGEPDHATLEALATKIQAALTNE